MSLLHRRAEHTRALPRLRWWVCAATATILALFFSAANLTLEDRTTPAQAAPGSALFVFGSTTGVTFSSPHSAGGNYLISWASLQPQSGAYSWTSLDAALGRAQSAGKKIVLRVYSNWSAFNQGTPSWFFNVSGARHYYPSSTAQSRDYKSPVPWDAVFQQQFSAFVSALGQRYDGHSAIEFIQITGIGVYGEVYLGQVRPSDFTASKHLGASRYWIDTWRDAFPDTNLALMVNGIGSNIGENAAEYAVDRGYYLQSNDHMNTASTRAIIAAHDQDTKIVIEAENRGCQTGTIAEGFEGQMAEAFALDYEIDYLMLCYESFSNAATAALLPWVADQLRSSTGSTEAAPTSTAVAQATATRTPAPTATPARTATPTPTATSRPPSPTPTTQVANVTPTPTPTRQSTAPTSTPTATPWWMRWFGWW